MSVDSSGTCDECGRIGAALYVRCPECGSDTSIKKHPARIGNAAPTKADELTAAIKAWRTLSAQWKNDWWCDYKKEMIVAALAEREQFLVDMRESLERLQRHRGAGLGHHRPNDLQKAQQMLAFHSGEFAEEKGELITNCETGSTLQREHWLRTMRYLVANYEEQRGIYALAPGQVVQEHHEEVAVKQIGEIRALLGSRNWEHFVPEHVPDGTHVHVEEAMLLREELAHLEKRLAADIAVFQERRVLQEEQRRERENLASAIEAALPSIDWTAVHQPGVPDFVREWQQRAPAADRDAWRAVRPSWDLAARRWRLARDLAEDRHTLNMDGNRTDCTVDSVSEGVISGAGLVPVEPSDLLRREAAAAAATLADVMWVKSTHRLLVELPRGLVKWRIGGIRRAYLDIGTGQPYATYDSRIGQYLQPEPYRQVVAACHARLLDFVERLELEQPSAPEVRVEGLAQPETLVTAVGDQRIALELIRGDTPLVFVTGAAGTGKSYLLRAIASDRKKVVVTAPTGVAAVNVDGATVHSVLGIRGDMPAGDALPDLGADQRAVLRRMSRIIIDEVSMVRADLLDVVDRRLKLARGSKAPFGGAQLVLFGDLYQLPPVVTGADHVMLEHQGYQSPFFFDAHVLEGEYRRADGSWTMALTTQHRQADDRRFSDLLGRLRTATQHAEDMRELNSRVISPQSISRTATVLCTTNRGAASINERKMQDLTGPVGVFVSRGSWSGSLPAEQVLEVKKKARVVLLRNDPDERFVNGSQGTVIDWSEAEVRVELDKGGVVSVGPARWEQREVFIDPDTDELEYRVVRVFRQIPLRLSWALTIHKSQGMTLDDLAIDMGSGGFASGQTYVALSRARKLTDVVLLRPLFPSDIFVDRRVRNFMEGITEG